MCGVHEGGTGRGAGQSSCCGQQLRASADLPLTASAARSTPHTDSGHTLLKWRSALLFHIVSPQTKTGLPTRAFLD